MENDLSTNFQVSPMRVLTLPEIHFFHVASEPVAFDKLDTVLDPLLEAIYNARRTAAITDHGPDIVRYYKNENGLYIMESGVSVPPETQPAGGARLIVLPSYPCAGVLLWGGLDHIVQAYEALTSAMKEAGLRHTGEVREITYSFESPFSPNNVMGIYEGIG